MKESPEDKFSEYGISIEDLEKNGKLLALIKQPWKLIREGGKLGVKGVKRFVINVFLFAVTNLILLFYAVSRMVSTHFAVSKIFIVLVVLILGCAITFQAATKTYRYVMIDTIRVIYGSLTTFFRKLSDRIIEKAEPVFKGKVSATNEQLMKALDYGKMVQITFRKSPKFLRKAVVLVLNRIPFAGFLTDLHGEINRGNKTEAGKKLYLKMDGYMQESVFGNNNTQWVWWWLPLNIIMQLLLIWWGIG